jgi:hypothetical protein
VLKWPLKRWVFVQRAHKLTRAQTQTTLRAALTILYLVGTCISCGFGESQI